MFFKLKVIHLIALWCCVDYYSLLEIKDDSLSEENLSKDVQILLGNDTVLKSILERYPGFYKIVMQVVNQTVLNGTRNQFNEAHICNVAKSTINSSQDTCLAQSTSTPYLCSVTQNITEGAKTSLSQLCSNNTGNASVPERSPTTLLATSMGTTTLVPSTGTTTERGNTINDEIMDNPVGKVPYSLPTDWPITPQTNSSTSEATSPTTLPATVPLTPTQKPGPPPPPEPNRQVASSYFFLAIKVAVKTAIISFERNCRIRMGVYVKERRVCIVSGNKELNETKNLTILYKARNGQSLRILNIFGNSCSIVAIILLIMEYLLCKSQFSLFEKNVTSLVLCLLISHMMQLLITFFNGNQMFCKASGIILHWALLSSFAWVSMISFDIFKTFSKTMRMDTERSKRKYRRYCIIALSASTVVTLICILIGIPTEDYSGYGHKGRCFIGKQWANLASFIIPIGLSLLLNIVLMIVTLVKIHAMQNRAAKTFAGKGSQSSSSRKKVVISFLILKLSVLFGLGWFLGFIDGVTNTTFLPFVYTGIVSLQGFFVFLCFGCHKALLRKLHQKKKPSEKEAAPILPTKAEKNIETETTQL